MKNALQFARRFFWIFLIKFSARVNLKKWKMFEHSAYFSHVANVKVKRYPVLKTGTSDLAGGEDLYQRGNNLIYQNEYPKERCGQNPIRKEFSSIKEFETSSTE